MSEANEAKITNRSDLHAGCPKYGRYATRPTHQQENLILKRSVVQGDHQTSKTPLDGFEPIPGQLLYAAYRPLYSLYTWLWVLLLMVLEKYNVICVAAQNSIYISSSCKFPSSGRHQVVSVHSKFPLLRTQSCIGQELPWLGWDHWPNKNFRSYSSAQLRKSRSIFSWEV